MLQSLAPLFRLAHTHQSQRSNLKMDANVVAR